MRKPAFCICENRGADQQVTAKLISGFVFGTWIVQSLYSSVSSDVAWESRGTAIDPCVQHILSLRFGHENIKF